MMSATSAYRWSPPGRPIRGPMPRLLPVCLVLALEPIGLGLAGAPLAAGETATVHDEVVHLTQGLITMKVNGEPLATGHEPSRRRQGLIRLYKGEYAVSYPWHEFADRDCRGRLLVRWGTPAAPALDLSEGEQGGVFIRQPSTGYFCNVPTVEGGDKFRWTKTIVGSDWKAIEEKLDLGRIKQVTDLAGGFSGRIYQMTFLGEKGRTTVHKELTIREPLASLRSSCFIAEWQRDAAGFIGGVELRGAGFGHGVGMCQTGAQALAKRGWTFDRLLAQSFPAVY